jgi:hypothetical protein
MTDRPTTVLVVGATGSIGRLGVEQPPAGSAPSAAGHEHPPCLGGSPLPLSLPVPGC